MQNCSPELREAFGNHYECYYFYWMLNQGTEQSVTATGFNCPAWLAVQLAYYQSEEYKNLNIYREQVDVDPVTLDPEAGKYTYTGSSNVYVSEYTARTLTQFDVFTEYVPVTFR